MCWAKPALTYQLFSDPSLWSDHDLKLWLPTLQSAAHTNYTDQLAQTICTPSLLELLIRDDGVPQATFSHHLFVNNIQSELL